MNSYFCSVHQYIVAFHVHGLQGLLSSVTLSLLMNSTFGTCRLCLYKVAWVRMYILAVVCLSVGTRPEFVPVFSFSSFPSVHWFSQKENRQSSRTEIMVVLASFPVWMIWEIRTWRLTLVMPWVILVLSPSNYNIFFLSWIYIYHPVWLSLGSSIIFSSRRQKEPQTSQIRLCRVQCKYLRNTTKALPVFRDA